MKEDELFDDFGLSVEERKDIYDSRIISLNNKIAELSRIKDNLNSRWLSFTEAEKEFCVDVISDCNIGIEAIQRKINYWQYRTKVLLGTVENTAKKSFDIDSIKQYPIENLMPYSPKITKGRILYYLCPLHNEKTPSFTVYRDQNTFHCYGCGAGSSNIDLVMHMEKIDFYSSCKEISTRL